MSEHGATNSEEDLREELSDTCSGHHAQGSGGPDEWARHLFSESEASIWRAAGFDALEASEWRDAGIDSPTEAYEWQLVDCDPCAACELRALGYDPSCVPAIDGLAGLLTAA